MRANDQLFWIWLAEALGADSSDFRKLFRLYQHPYDVFCADAEELERIHVLSPRSIQALSDKSLESATAILDRCEQMGIGMLHYRAALYPPLLQDIKNPPILLYYMGKLPKWEDLPFVGMVGTRKMSAYGMETAYKISYELSSAGGVIVSGMAEGIDGVCAAGALRAGGSTIAVLGCGLDIAYPRHHGLLMKTIAENGLLLSEYAPGTKPIHYHFPSRNRIISGLSHGVVVVEAGLGSGSLITAKEAVMQGRDVFAIPANADGIGTVGANGLLRDGAVFATGSADILNRYAYLFPKASQGDFMKKIRARSDVDLPYLRQLGIIKALPQQTAQAPLEPEGIRQTDPKQIIKQDLPKAEACQSASVNKSEAPEKSQPSPKADLGKLTPIQLAVLQAMPDRGSITVDALMSLGHTQGEVLVALTMLEIAGLVQKLPGASYQKA